MLQIKTTCVGFWFRIIRQATCVAEIICWIPEVPKLSVWVLGLYKVVFRCDRVVVVGFIILSDYGSDLHLMVRRESPVPSRQESAHLRRRSDGVYDSTNKSRCLAYCWMRFN